MNIIGLTKQMAQLAQARKVLKEGFGSAIVKFTVDYEKRIDDINSRIILLNDQIQELKKQQEVKKSEENVGQKKANGKN